MVYTFKKNLQVLFYFHYLLYLGDWPRKIAHRSLCHVEAHKDLDFCVNDRTPLREHLASLVGHAQSALSWLDVLHTSFILTGKEHAANFDADELVPGHIHMSIHKALRLLFSRIKALECKAKLSGIDVL